ncbi:MAG: PadR family transcriptional regulator [Candidatus Heimdallarchaeaceae archaeon]
MVVAQAIYFLVSDSIIFFWCSTIILGAAFVLNLLQRLNYTRIFDVFFAFLLKMYDAYNTKVHKEERIKTKDWQIIRETLSEILLRKEIVVAKQELQLGEKKENKTLDVSETMQNFLKENPDFIEKLRVIGVDGLLCLIFLLEHLPALVSARTIQHVLRIPIATLYRQLQKLTEEQLIETQYLASGPGKTYYRITEKGTSIVIDLYEFLGGTIMLPINSKNKVNEEVKGAT